MVNRTDTHIESRWCMYKTVCENSTVGSDEQFSTVQHLLRPTSNVRAFASHSNTASLRIMVCTRRILATVGSKSCFLWLQDTNDGGRRNLCARVGHGLPLATPTQLRNGSSASLFATVFGACRTTVTHAWHEEKLLTTFQTTSQKNNHRTFVRNATSSLQIQSRPQSLAKCPRAAPSSQSKRVCPSRPHQQRLCGYTNSVAQ